MGSTYEGFLGGLGNKGAKNKYHREQGNNYLPVFGNTGKC